jgi:hypothetical protein
VKFVSGVPHCAIPGELVGFRKRRRSAGEMFCRLWLAAEIMALVIANHEGSLKAAA